MRRLKDTAVSAHTDKSTTCETETLRVAVALPAPFIKLNVKGG